MKPTLWTPEFLGMSFSSFFQYMTHYALITALPIFVIENLNGNDWSAGLAMTFFQIGAVLCRPLAGKWIDDYNKKKILLLSAIVFLITSILYLCIDNLTFLLAIRLIHGAVFAIGTTTAATVAALVLPPQRKGEGIGYFAVFSNLAMVVGPFFSLLIISYYQFNSLFACCTLLAIASFWCSNRKKLPNDIILPVTKKDQTFKWTNFIEPNALPMALLGGLVFFAYAGVLVFMPLYAKMLDLTNYTSMFFAIFAIVIVITRPIVGKLFDQSGPNFVVYPGFLIFLIGLVILSQISTLSGLLLAGAVLGIGFGALSPAFQTLAIQHSPVARSGVATATYFLALDISVGLGSFILSLAAAQLGYRSMYLASACILLLASVLYYLLAKQSKKNR
ncbi:MFS transporter [Propionispira raffinosivorans]|uniref:MFS transporter n=1 Tax=Propionispira raffinosivorans TaxID=86959 RepID=UPI00036B4A9B|nr:MFS transporter [Propionispira raffinosivorans]